MRVKKTDANQARIMKQCRQIPGVSVVTIHEVGKGLGDILLGFRKINYIIEIKDGSKVKSARKLTPAEEKFHKEWQGQISVAETIEDIVKLINR